MCTEMCGIMRANQVRYVSMYPLSFFLRQRRDENFLFIFFRNVQIEDLVIFSFFKVQKFLFEPRTKVSISQTEHLTEIPNQAFDKNLTKLEITDQHIYQD